MTQEPGPEAPEDDVSPRPDPERPATAGDITRVLEILREEQEANARRESRDKGEIRELTRRIQELEDGAGPAEPARFGPFGIFHRDQDTGSYQLALPLLIAITGAIFGMLLTQI